LVKMRCKVCDIELKKGLEMKQGFCEECARILKRGAGIRAFLARVFGFEEVPRVDPGALKKILKRQDVDAKETF